MFAHDPASEALTLAISPSKLKIPESNIVLMSFSTGKVWSRILHAFAFYFFDPTSDIYFIPRYAIFTKMPIITTGGLCNGFQSLQTFFGIV